MIPSLSKQLHIALGITEFQLDRIIQRSPNTYKTYAIPKRSGGFRIIAQPAKETKFIQYWLMSNIFHGLQVHDRATAYKKEASITKNVAIHQNNTYIAKFDFKDFFGSIKYSAVLLFLKARLAEKFNSDDVAKIARVSCIKHIGHEELCLSIGAPSSPILSNAIMHDFDEEVSRWCADQGLTYSRYADDLTFSTNTKNICSEIERKLRAVILELTDLQLILNDKKTVHLSKKFQRRITGLVINNKNEISLGRERKREISALIHKFSINRLPDEEICRLQGLLGFASDAEPSFVLSMNNKYGNQLIDDIFRKRKEKLGAKLGL